jgi:endonuclease/exonuclease/phosphatase family metal-dependent hydrolase
LAAPSQFSLLPHPEGEQLAMERWRQNVGSPVAFDVPSTETPGQLGPLVVLSWNVWIGRGRLREVVSRIRDGKYQKFGAERDAPLVLLIQEAYRSDASLPPPQGRAGRFFGAARTPQEDIVETARLLRLNLRYAPSMRNGLLPSDRGNAVLSSLPLTNAHAVELPLVLQRRVAVSAELAIGEHRIQLVSAHLDPRGPPGHQWLGLAGRERQARHLVASVGNSTVILGADLNLGRGRYEQAWRLLGEAGFTFGVPPAIPGWRHTFHALPRLVLDYLLVRDRAGLIHQARVHRLDEHPNDRGSRVFGSDHHPLLARIDLQPSDEPR